VLADVDDACHDAMLPSARVALPCSRCFTQVPAEAVFCPACGAPLRATPEQLARAAAAPHAQFGPPAMPPPVATAASAPASAIAAEHAVAAPPAGPQGCRGCGVQIATSRTGCDVCATPYSEGHVPLPEAGDTLWVAVRCRFQCRSCGHLSPLDQLDMDGSVTCLRCGLDQIFDVESWRDGLDHAMRAGVLAGTGKFDALGKTRSSLEFVQSGFQLKDGIMTTRSLRVAAGPGHPLCGTCHEPLRVELDEAGEARSRCPTCGEGMRCVLPGPARRMCQPIRAVLAEELATDRREAKVEASAGANAGAIAITCPHCAAPLSVTGASSIVTCEYCHASSRIPSRTLFRLGHDHPTPKVWWLGFDRAAARQQVLPRPRPATPPPDAPSSSPRPQPSPPTPAKRRVHPGPGVLLSLGVVAAVGLVGFRGQLARWRDGVPAIAPAPVAGSAAPPPAPGAPGSPAREPAPAAAPQPPRGPFVSLAGCRCGTAQIHVQVTQRPDRALVWFRADRTGHDPVSLLGVETDKRKLGLAVACSGDTLALAIGEHVRAWSLATGELRWERELAASYRYRGKDPDNGISLYCTPLRVQRGRFDVPTGARGATIVELATGKLDARR
jgi:hypothetical protein